MYVQQITVTGTLAAQTEVILSMQFVNVWKVSKEQVSTILQVNYLEKNGIKK